MKAGIDLGTTLIKVVLANEHNEIQQYQSVQYGEREKLIDSLKNTRVEEGFVTGIGKCDFPFPVKRLDGDPITNEIILQAEGARKLLEESGDPHKGFGLISVGTGVSYTFVYDTVINKLPIGSFLGGGFIYGILNSMEMDISDVDDYEPDPNWNADICVKDIMPDTKGTFTGDLLIAACARMNQTWWGTKDGGYAILNMVAASIMRDVMMYQVTQTWNPNRLVFIGTVIQQSSVLRKLLTDYATKMGFKVSIPNYANYAGAMGALLRM